MPGPLTEEEKIVVDNAIALYAKGERAKWCQDLLNYLGQFKWAGNTADWSSDATENLAMNCWCAPIYVAHKTGRLKKKTVDDFSMLAFQYPTLSALHASQRAAFEFLKGAGAGGDEGIPGDLIFFFLDSLEGVYGKDKYAASVPLAQCPVHVAVNMGPGACVSLWSTPNDYDKYQLVKIRELVDAIERDRKARCNFTSIEPFWITGAKTKKPCYITTAACQSRGLPDECHELTTLRWFRDEIVSRTPAGLHDIQTYYDTAPKIVAAIDKQTDAAELYDWVYRERIRPALAAVECGQYQEAQTRLQGLVEELQQRYS